jgi:glycosyltransferase involved in cell wall biosynthesis
MARAEPAPRISVVMPVRDAAAFLAEAVESVLAQTRPDWELLVVDDGSRDATPAIIRGFASRDPRVRSLGDADGQSRGASWARNVAIRHARGEYIAFLDADDVWLPDKLEAQVPMLDARPEVGILYARTLFWSSWAAPGAEPDFTPALGVPLGTIVAPPRLLERILRDQAAVPCTCSVLVRKSVVDSVGGFEEAFRAVFTDQSFYAKVLLATSALAADGCWDRYRQHPESSVKRAERSGRLAALQLEYLVWLEAYARESPRADAAVRRAIRRAIFLNRHIRWYRAYRRLHAFAGRQRRTLARLLGRPIIEDRSPPR